MKFFRRNRLSRKSIKESIDNLPSGLCFFEHTGLLILCNRKMYHLAYLLMGYDLQTWDELSDALKSPQTQHVVFHLNDAFVFDDQTAWQFRVSSVRTSEGEVYTQVVASEVTEIYEKYQQLQKSRQKLDEMNIHLKNISENIRDIVREEETLSIKMQVHDDIGRGMIMARQLLAKGADAKEIRQNCSQMEMTVDYLNYMNQTEQKNNDLKQLCDRAAMMGVQLHVEGALPTKEIARTIFLNAIRECVTNCVRHAGGNKVEAQILYQNGIILSVTNNGSVPTGLIREGGGLSSLRQQVEKARGVMTVLAVPVFELRIQMPE